MWTAIFLLWLSPIFGGQGEHGQPMRVTVEYPDEAGCHKQLLIFKKSTVRHEVQQDCTWNDRIR